MAQFIAIARRNYERYSEADFTPELLGAEAEQARVLYAQGIYRQVWGHTSPAGAVILMEAEDAAAAQAAVETLPLYRNGMLAIELIALGPYRGFAPRTTT